MFLSLYFPVDIIMKETGVTSVYPVLVKRDAMSVVDRLCLPKADERLNLSAFAVDQST